MKIIEMFKGKKVKQGKGKIPKEILDKLPKGAKVKQIIIGPKFVMKLVIYLLVGYLILSTVVSSLLPEDMQIGISEAVDVIKKNEVEEVVVIDNQLFLTLKENGKVLIASKEGDSSFVEILQNEGVDLGSLNVRIENRQGMKLFGDILNIFLMVGLPILVLLWFMKKSGGMGGGGGMFGFGKSNAKLFVKGKLDLTFKDVAGVKEAKDDLQEVVDFLKNPKKYQKMGARTPKGVLLVGPSGVGKTLLAKAVAGEANVSFFSMAGSEFMEMLVGVGASVTGDTPVLVRKNNKVRLVAIEQIVDEYYKKGEGEMTKKVEGLETLGFDKATNKFWGSKSKNSRKAVFGNSNWKKVSRVYRHRANNIYEIEYLGGKLRTTGDHSVFIRSRGWIEAKRADELKPGDILVNLPMKTRHWDYELKKTIHTIKAHVFEKQEKELLDVWQDDRKEWEKYDYVMKNEFGLSQKNLALEVGVCQMTVSNWQREIHVPMAVSKKLVKLDLPNSVEVSKDLMWLFGIYTAEGRGTNSLEFTFGIDEKDLVVKTAKLMDRVFGLDKPTIRETKTNSVKVIYYSAHLGRFFAKYCGNGSHNKKVPEFIWNLPSDYFLPYLRGWVDGDGYVYKTGKLTGVSVSQRLIRELAWLCSMHGIKVGTRKELVKGGRIISNKPLPDSLVWKLIIGKTANPFLKKHKYPNQFKKCYVKKIVKKKYDDYVYDLCGVDNEAFFGGEKPMLLHNSRVRDLFSTAKKAGKAIIFIDEIDAIGRMRGGLGGQSHGEREQTLNQILVEMDGFEANTTVIVLAATNRGDLLDPALLRPGRFDRRVVLEMPDIADRKDILAIHAKGKPFGKDVNWDRVAESTVGFSGADLENMLNEAAIKAARENKTEIDRSDIEEASLKVKMGSEKRRVQTDEDKKMTAYHEAGHAIVNFAEKLDPVDRISIVSRGMALGFTLIPPSKDRIHETKSNLIKQMAMAMGGRAAEEIVFGDMTTGASSDIQQASKIAREMVTSWGMSKLGPVNLGSQITGGEYGNSYLEPSQVSDGMKAEVDAEIQRFVDEAHKEAINVLKKNRKRMDEIVKVLVKQETLGREEFEKLMR